MLSAGPERTGGPVEEPGVQSEHRHTPACEQLVLGAGGGTGWEVIQNAKPTEHPGTGSPPQPGTCASVDPSLLKEILKSIVTTVLLKGEDKFWP